MKRRHKNRIWKALKLSFGRYYYERFRARYNLGYNPNFKNPRTFNEHIMHKKLYQNMDFAINLTDKYAVRNFVQDKIGREYLPQNYYVGRNLRPINWSNMPEQFVIKTTHAGGDEGNIFVWDKQKMNIPKIIEQTNENLNKHFGYWTNEDWYLKIKPRVIIEELLLDKKGKIPSDFKFFCFSGKAHFVQVNSDRYEKHYRSFYSVDWKLQDFNVGPIPSTHIEKPKHLDEMIALSEKLSEGFDFVRVDLYDLPDGVKFGELTFTPNGGHEAFHPREVDYEWGHLMRGD